MTDFKPIRVRLSSKGLGLVACILIWFIVHWWKVVWFNLVISPRMLSSCG